MERLQRERLLLGSGVDILMGKHVAVFGIGGVGSYAAEALARSGVGEISLFDADTVDVTNINRQLIALSSTVGRYKAEVMAERIADIMPDTVVNVHNVFYSQSNSEDFPLDAYDYIVDAIDTVSSKLTLIVNAKACGVPIISCMGAGNKLDPTRFEVSDIFATQVCPLARVMRRELKLRNIDSLKVVYSKESPLTPAETGTQCAVECGAEHARRQTPGSVAFVPSVAGLIMAGEVVKELCGVGGSKHDG